MIDFLKDFTSALVDEGVKYVSQAGFCMSFLPSTIIYLFLIIIAMFIADRVYMYGKMQLQEKKLDTFIEGKAETSGK
jgi:hypothetical protein